MSTDPAALLPQTKYETDKASELVRLGYPAVKPILAEILEWVQDINWPVARVFHPFLVSIGQPLAPYIRDVLAGQDETWKYSLLSVVVHQAPGLAQTLRPELERLAKSPTLGESGEEVDQLARELLKALNGAPEA